MLHRLFFLIFLLANSAFSINAEGQEVVLFKQVDTTRLYLEVIRPDSFDSTKQYPATVFFFGGGWKTGKRSQFRHQAEFLAARGMVCFLADYRIETKHQTTPFESLKDAKSAMRFVRQHSAEFSIDPDRIVAAGGSAGGHLAAATAMISGFNEASDDLTVSCKPNALVLFNPVVDNSPAGYGYERLGSRYLEFSLMHQVRQGLPPTIFFLGNRDHLIPVETARYFCTAMEEVGNTCELKLFKRVGHGFFNYQNTRNYKKSMKQVAGFLRARGFLD